MTYSVSSGMLNPTISILCTLVKKLCDKNKMYVHRPFQQDLKQHHFTLPEAADCLWRIMYGAVQYSCVPETTTTTYLDRNVQFYVVQV